MSDGNPFIPIMFLLVIAAILVTAGPQAPDVEVVGVESNESLTTIQVDIFADNADDVYATVVAEDGTEKQSKLSDDPGWAKQTIENLSASPSDTLLIRYNSGDEYCFKFQKDDSGEFRTAPADCPDLHSEGESR